jgi:hypothetical protein
MGASVCRSALIVIRQDYPSLCAIPFLVITWPPPRSDRDGLSLSIIDNTGGANYTIYNCETKESFTNLTPPSFLLDLKMRLLIFGSKIARPAECRARL